MKHLYIILFVLSSQLIFAQQIVTDRPDQTESSSTIQARAFQFETGFQMSYFGGGVIGV